MQNQLHQETLKEIAKVKAYLGHLEAMKAFLEGGGIPAPSAAATKPAKPAPVLRKRALPGSFQAALLNVFSAGDTLSNANVRDRLKQARYGTFDNSQVRKTLTKLAKQGKLVKVPDGDGVAYKLP